MRNNFTRILMICIVFVCTSLKASLESAAREPTEETRNYRSTLFKDAPEEHQKIRTREDDIRMRAQQARQHIKEFPDDPRGYGLLLAVAKGESGRGGADLAREILNNKNTPEQHKEGARQVLAQNKLLGRCLEIEGINIQSYAGNPLVIYTWTLKQPDVFSLLKVWSEIPGVQFLGINLDEDTEKAGQLARTQTLPGSMLYDGKGPYGPLCKQLRFLSSTSAYIIDSSGVLADVNGLEDTLGKLKALAQSTKESQ